MTARVDVGSGFVGEFATDDLTPSWRRVPMFGRNSTNGSVKRLGVPDFLMNDGPPWTANLLSPYASWGDRGPITNLKWGSQYVWGPDSVFVFWNRPIRVLSVYHRMIFENPRSAARRIRDNLLRENCTACMQSPSTCHNPICDCLVNQRDDDWDDLWDEPVDQ